MADPKVTVLMPVFNAEKYIGEAVRSILLQDFDSFELLIINDGSTDNSVEVINSFHDPRIRLINQENSGVSGALNNGLIAAKGRYIARFDADDICLPGRLKTQAHFLDDHPDYFICGSDAEYIMEDGKHLFDFYCVIYEDEQIRKKLYAGCPFIHSSVMYRKDTILNAGGYPLYAHSFEDYLLWVQLKDKGKFYNTSQQFIKVRLSTSSFTIDEKWRGKKFNKLKQQIIHKGFATEEDGKNLLAVIKKQEKGKTKPGAYYALCGKKLLVNNHQPAMARKFLRKAIACSPLRADSYLLYILSFFSKKLIGLLYHVAKKVKY